MITALLDNDRQFFFNGFVGFLTSWGAARTSAMSDPNLAADLAVALPKVLLEANNTTVTTREGIGRDVGEAGREGAGRGGPRGGEEE